MFVYITQSLFSYKNPSFHGHLHILMNDMHLMLWKWFLCKNVRIIHTKIQLCSHLPQLFRVQPLCIMVCSRKLLIISWKYSNSLIPIFVDRGKNTNVCGLLNLWFLRFLVYKSMDISFSLGTKFRGLAYPRKPQKLVPNKQ